MLAGGINMTVFWLIAMVVLLVIEGVIPGLVSIWFAAGALAALLTGSGRSSTSVILRWIIFSSSSGTVSFRSPPLFFGMRTV